MAAPGNLMFNVACQGVFEHPDISSCYVQQISIRDVGEGDRVWTLVPPAGAEGPTRMDPTLVGGDSVAELALRVDLALRLPLSYVCLTSREYGDMTSTPVTAIGAICLLEAGKTYTLVLKGTQVGDSLSVKAQFVPNMFA